MIDFSCPHCRTALHIGDEYAGTTGNCPHCGGVLTVQEPANGKHTAESTTAPPAKKNGNGRPASPVVMMPVSRDIEALHFTLQEIIRTYAARADRDPLAKSLAIQAAHQMIAIAPYVKQHLQFAYDRPLPEHPGFAHLADVLERERLYDKARKVCLNAKFQGWQGDWDTRIARCEERRHQHAVEMNHE
jgi:uncharacterized Zn finger protein (UPF0148 family)